MRIVVANEPRAYREAVAGAFRRLRPLLEVITVEPQELDAVIARLSPGLVVCSAMTEALEGASTTWILLYPGGEPHAVISIDGQRTTHADVELAHLLWLIDQSMVLPDFGETEVTVPSDVTGAAGAYAEPWQQ